jgi:hypothetical protein
VKWHPLRYDDFGWRLSDRGIGMDARSTHVFDPPDVQLMQVRARLSPGERLQAMLDAREWVIGAARARIQRRHPELSSVEVNLKILEEIERAKRREARS